MSSMFKSVLNSLNGHSKSQAASKETCNLTLVEEPDCKRVSAGKALNRCQKVELPNGIKPGSCVESNYDENNKSSATFTNNKQSTTIGIGKKSRKKFSAMMGKIQSSVVNYNNHTGRSTSKHNNNNDRGNHSEHNNNNLDDDNDTYSEALQDSKELDKFSEFTLSDREDEDEDDGDKKKASILPEEECDIPTFLHTKNCDLHLIEETRTLLKERYSKNPDSFYPEDYKRMLSDDWTVSRFLLRRRLDPKRSAKLMEECGRFRKQYKMSEVKLWEFPIEFHKAGGLFKYAPDRVGNQTVYMRVKMYRRVPEISDVFKAFILCVLEEADIENQGRGVAVIFDLSGCGLQNVDLSFLSWLLSSFRNYCPKGVSYILVYNLPWILSATCKLAMTWMSASNRRALRFVHGDEIENFISPDNLPDYCGGTCKLNYRAIPEGSLPAIEVCDRLDMTREQALKIRELFKEYLDEDSESKKSRTVVESDDDDHYEDTKTQFANGTLSGGGGGEVPLANSNTSQPTSDIVAQASKFIA